MRRFRIFTTPNNDADRLGRAAAKPTNERCRFPRDLLNDLQHRFVNALERHRERPLHCP